MKKISAIMAMLALTALSAWSASEVKGVTAIGWVLGDGAKTAAVAVEYDTDIDASSITAKSYEVTRAYTNSRNPRQAGARHSQHRGWQQACKKAQPLFHRCLYAPVVARHLPERLPHHQGLRPGI